MPTELDDDGENAAVPPPVLAGSGVGTSGAVGDVGGVAGGSATTGGNGPAAGVAGPLWATGSSCVDVSSTTPPGGEPKRLRTSCTCSAASTDVTSVRQVTTTASTIHTNSEGSWTDSGGGAGERKAGGRAARAAKARWRAGGAARSCAARPSPHRG